MGEGRNVKMDDLCALTVNLPTLRGQKRMTFPDFPKKYFCFWVARSHFLCYYERHRKTNDRRGWT